MTRQVHIVFALTVSMIVTSCVRQPAKVWQPGEGTVWQRVSERAIEKMISVPVDRDQPSAGNFNLHYFILTPTGAKAKKNVLFCAGGPGQIVPSPYDPTFANFLSNNGYNVIIFHQRGAGFSQIPAGNEYDRFLKTSYVVADIEAIRTDFLGKDGKWDAIIGWSYGTIVAQQYAHFHPERVDRLVLLGPESRHEFASSMDAFSKLTDAVRDINRETLGNILERAPDDLTSNEKTAVLETAIGTTARPGIYNRVEEAFGSIQFVIDSYDKLRDQKELEKYGFGNYSRDFFQGLRSLHMSGWLKDSKDSDGKNNQWLAGCVIIKEILFKKDDYCVKQEIPKGGRGSSQRVFYVSGTYDGINARFLNEWLKNGKQHVIDALRKSGGEANHLRNVNDALGKVGISDSETIRPWDPADYPHNKPTLVLKGGADTTSAGGQAERFYLDALTGPRVLVEFPGIGHQFSLMQMPNDNQVWLTGTVLVDPPAIEPGETRSVLGTYNGRKLDERFLFKLETIGLEPGLKLADFSIVETADKTNGENKAPKVIALIQNTGDQPVDGRGREWILSNKFYKAKVDLDPPLIAPGTMSAVLGAIKLGGKRNEENAIQIKRPDNLEEGVEDICFDVTNSSDLMIWLKNKNSSGPPVDVRANDWTVSKGPFSKTFTVGPFSLAPQEVGRFVFPIDGLQLESAELVTLKLPDDLDDALQGCLSPNPTGSNDISIVIRNKDDRQVNDGVEREWIIDSPMFSIKVKLGPLVGPLSIPPKSGLVVTATVLSLTLTQWSRLMSPSKLEQGLEFRGFNIHSDVNVSVLLDNTSPSRLDGIARDWVYKDPNESTSNPLACVGGNTGQSSYLDCLIYSYLIMDTETFISDHDNTVLEKLMGKPFFARVCRLNGAGQNPGKINMGTCP